MNLFSVKDKVVVITGGSGLIGKCLLKTFVDSGSIVINIDLDEFCYRDSHYFNVNACIEKDINECVDTIISNYSKIDVWINCFYPKKSEWNKPANELPSILFEESVVAHLNGNFLCSKIAGNTMANTKTQGTIINFSSIYGNLVPNINIYEGTNKIVPISYGVSKASIINISKYFAVFYAKNGIRVNTISPTAVLNNQHDKIIDYYKRATPLGRILLTDEIPGVAIFLASNASSFITGQNIVIDGGYGLI